jgi:hypothetical protein
MRMRFAAYLTDDEPPELALYWSECAEPSFGTNPAGARRPRLVNGQLRRPAVPPEAARPLISNGAALDQNLQPGHWARSSTTSTGGWSASSSRTSSTCSVLRPSGIVSPGLQVRHRAADLRRVRRCAMRCLELEQKPAIRFSLPCRLGPNGRASISRPAEHARECS